MTARTRHVNRRIAVIALTASGIVAAVGGASAWWVRTIGDQQRVLSRTDAILQRDSDDCGIAALENVYAARGLEAARARLRDRLHPAHGGVSMLALRDRARADGLPAAGIRVSAQALAGVPLPAIVPVDAHHFLVVQRFDSEGSVIAIDPARGVVQMTLARFEARWRGMALCFGDTQACLGGEVNKVDERRDR